LNLSCNLRLHWLREPSLGLLLPGRLPQTRAVPGSLSSVLAGAAGLSEDASLSLARKILSALPQTLDLRPGSEFIEVQLPFLGRRNWKHREQAVAQYEPEIDLEGRVLLRSPETPALETDVYSACAAGFAGGSADFRFSFTDRRTLTPLQARIWLPVILAGYQFPTKEISAIVADGEDGIEAAITISLPGTCGAAWLSAPEERNPSSFDTYLRLAKAVQLAVRRWLPYIYFRNAGSYADQEAIPLLVYGATRPFRGKPRSTFTFDVLNTELVDLFFRLALRDVEPLAERIAAALMEAGHPEIAESYGHARGRGLVEVARKKRRLTHGLLVADGVILEALLKLGNEANSIGRTAATDSKRAVRALSNSCDGFVSTWQGKLRRLYASEDFRPFGSLLLIEATRGLCPDVPLRVTARLTTSRGTRLVVTEGRLQESS
jgi:hypothetical protein